MGTKNHTVLLCKSSGKKDAALYYLVKGLVVDCPHKGVRRNTVHLSYISDIRKVRKKCPEVVSKSFPTLSLPLSTLNQQFLLFVLLLAQSRPINYRHINTMETTTAAAAGLVVERTNLERIEGFFKSSSYRESLEMSASFNSRLTLERKLRLPFLDPQTGVAQRNCSLQVKARQRMPGLRHGQIYSFPALRWRKSKRQYLNTLLNDCQLSMSSLNSSGLSTGTAGCTNNGSITGGAGLAGGSTSGGFLVSQHDDNSNSNASFMLEKFQTEALLDGDTNSRDTNNNSKEELSKDWLYEDLDNDFDTFSEPKSADDEYDYDPRYGNKKRQKKASKKEARPKKAATSFGGFDFNEMRSSMKSRRSKDGTQTPKKTGEGGGSAGVGRPRRKGTATTATGGGGGKKKKFVEPPSFESAAAAMDSNPLSFSSGSGW